MENARLRISRRAERDFAEIWQYIARDNPRLATDFCAQLLDETHLLLLSPKRGSSFRKRSNTRKLVFGSYLIIYEINEDEDCIEILRFWHGARNPTSLRLGEAPAQYGQASVALDASVIP